MSKLSYSSNSEIGQAPVSFATRNTIDKAMAKKMLSMQKQKILIVDDDQRLCRLLARYLEQDGYETESTTDGDEIHRMLLVDSFDLILLDIMMPGKDGLALAQEVRNQSDIPIIFLSARADITDKVSGLEIGADDYITKPFEEKELLARIHSVLRRTRSDEAKRDKKSQAVFAGWKFNLASQTLSSPEGKQVDITTSEYQLLAMMVTRPYVAISRDHILNIISGRKWTPLDRSADMAISKLRRKIESNPDKPMLIKTVRNKGYQLAANVEFVEPQ